jgi:parallel beta-helix repeat protein
MSGQFHHRKSRGRAPLLAFFLTLLFVPLLCPVAAFATHVSCGQVLTTDTQLDSDLIDCPNHGLVVGANGIIVDLNGHTVDGNQSFNFREAGVLVPSGYTKAEIRNGTIRQFDHGVFLNFNSDWNFAHDLTLENNEFGLGADGSFNNTITHNRVLDNPAPGISLRFNSSGNTVKWNYVRGVSQQPLWGILLFAADGNRVQGNVVTGFGSGIEVSADRNEILGNWVIGNRGGIGLGLRAEDNVVARNTTTNNSVLGIRLSDSSRNRIERNLVWRNSEVGIAVDRGGFGDPSTDNVIEANLVGKNGSGINVVLESHRNSLIHNTVVGNREDGILIAETAMGNLTESNRAIRNGDDGIDIRTQTTVTGNIANANVDWGIVAAPGVIDGGGNRARGNGQPAQCAIVACG